MTLTGKQRRALRALGHHLDPLILVGKEGVTASLTAAVEQALEDHELIKLKVGENSPLDRHEVSEMLAESTGAEIAQVLGRTILLFRRNPEKPQVEVPGLPMPKPAPAEKEASGKPAARKPAAKKAGARKPAARPPRD